MGDHSLDRRLLLHSSLLTIRLNHQHSAPLLLALARWRCWDIWQIRERVDGQLPGWKEGRAGPYVSEEKAWAGGDGPLGKSREARGAGLNSQHSLKLDGCRCAHLKSPAPPKRWLVGAGESPNQQASQPGTNSNKQETKRLCLNKVEGGTNTWGCPLTATHVYHHTHTHPKNKTKQQQKQLVLDLRRRQRAGRGSREGSEATLSPHLSINHLSSS